MVADPLKKLTALGQSIWLDYIKRDLFINDKLSQLIAKYSLKGMTSNPSLFEKAISESSDYDQDIQKMAREGKDAEQIYAALTVKDVQDAADTFRSIYDKTHGEDGYVSLEVNPHLARDTQGTIKEARQLWKALDRPNVFIKVPATKEGLPAITQLISDGINVNITLLFGLERYREVANAYLAGIKTRITQGKSVKQIASVASFFLSRIDVLIDPMLQTEITNHSEMGNFAAQLVGEIAIASARLASQISDDIFKSHSFKEMAAEGASIQRLLWASTGTKNPEYSDVKYVEALIGPHTVNTLPLETIEAYADHGDPAIRLNLYLDKSHFFFQTLSELGINIDQITQQLEDEGVDKFEKAYDQLLKSLQKKIQG